MQNSCQKHTLVWFIISMVRLSILLILVAVLSSCGKSKHDIAPPIKTSFKIYNKGINGNTAGNLMGRVGLDVLNLKPDLVIVMIGTNDVSKGVTFSIYRSNLTNVISSIKGIGADVLLISPPPRGVDVISFPQYFLNDKIDTVVQINNTLSKELGCYYLDINKAFKDAGTPNPTAASMLFNAANNPAMPDGIHPNAEGMKFIAKTIYNYMKANVHVKQQYRDITIVCFGDSITWGLGGTASYPSQLDLLLNN